MKNEPLFKERERGTGLVVIHLTRSVFRQHFDSFLALFSV